MYAKRVRFMETSRVRAAIPPRQAAGAEHSLPQGAGDRRGCAGSVPFGAVPTSARG